MPVGRVVNVKDIVEAEQLKARGAIEEVWVDGPKEKTGDAEAGWSVKMQGSFPLLEGCDTKTRWAGPDLGYHTDEVLMGDLGMSQEEVQSLRTAQVIG